MTHPNLSDWFLDLVMSQLAPLDLTIQDVTSDTICVVDPKGGLVTVTSSEQGCVRASGPVVYVGDVDAPPSQEVFAHLGFDTSAEVMLRTLKNGVMFDRLKRDGQSNRQDIRRKDYLLRELIEIGKSLSMYQSIDELLSTILEKSRHIMGSDAGSIYVVEGDQHDILQCRLRFKLIQNDSITVESEEFVMPVSVTSIAGATVVMKRAIVIDDVRNISKDASYHFDASFDERTGYRTISVLSVPMINQEGLVMGVIQLINKKRNPSVKLLSPNDFEKQVIAMDAESIDLVETLASQAGIAMENARLYDEIRNIFNGFIKASVHAIEQRDPTTSGHSFRVAALTRELARVVSNQKEGRFKDVTFDDEDIKEIETAALLHDFGKVGVREEVLLKAKKLYPQNLEVIRARIDFIRTSIENDHLQRRMMMIEEGTPSEELAILDEGKARSIAEIDECWRIINTANEPTVLTEGDFAKVEDVAGRTFFDINGTRRHYLEKEEVEALLVAKGSLTADELEEIRNHAAHTLSFLERIPWGRRMRNIPAYAGCHHEKLDGSGYPRKLKDQDIPLPSKIMAVADIYDALTAADRPYKKAVPLQKALQILDFEVRDRHIDGDLVDLFRRFEVYKVVDGVDPADLIEP